MILYREVVHMSVLKFSTRINAVTKNQCKYFFNDEKPAARSGVSKRTCAPRGEELDQYLSRSATLRR